MPKLRIVLFGRLQCEIAGVGVVNVDAFKAQELLSYLALNRSRLHHRDALSTLLWGDRSEAQAKKGLRQTLWLLQSALLNASNGATKEIFVIDGDWIGFNPQADVEVDAERLERVYHRFHPASPQSLSRDDVVEICDVSHLYTNALLEGWYQEWCIHERERFEFMYLSLLDKLLGYYEMAGDYEGGINCGIQILRCDRARESTHRRLMRLHYVAGHRTRAINQYAACVAALKEELGVEPSKSTQRLHRQICDDQLNGSVPPLEPLLAQLTTEPHPPSSDPLNELLQIRRLVDILQQQVDFIIASLQHT